MMNSKAYRKTKPPPTQKLELKPRVLHAAGFSDDLLNMMHRTLSKGLGSQN